MLALARELGIPARPVLARSRLVAEASAPMPPQELDDFADALVELDVGGAGGPPSSGPTCACATRRSAICRPGWTARDAVASPTVSFGFARKTACAGSPDAST